MKAVLTDTHDSNARNAQKIVTRALWRPLRLMSAFRGQTVLSMSANVVNSAANGLFADLSRFVIGMDFFDALSFHSQESGILTLGSTEYR